MQDPATNDAYAVSGDSKGLPPAEVEGYLFSSRWRPVTRSKDDGQPPVAGFCRSHWVEDGLSFLFAVCNDPSDPQWSFEDMHHTAFTREIQFVW